jgi:hypothetical protein
MDQFVKSIQAALPDTGVPPPPEAPANCIKDDMITQGDPTGLNCCGQNGTYGNWRGGFQCMSKQGLTFTSTYMGFPVWFWVVFMLVLATIVLTKILSR